ncbi:MAG TPA: glycosyltransferase, partial [Dehalococcoidia bacterium]|nr:glycosyltransferase [Dehalococcoidia bacterium]
FANVTRAMYQALGGIYLPWTQDMTDTWLDYASMNADLLTEPFDVVIVHDPQPAAIRSFVTDSGAKWLYHSHLDLSSAQDDVWMQLRSHIEAFDATIFEAHHFTRDDIGTKTYIVPPAIDPNSPRNMPLPDDVVRTVLERYGIDPDRPLVVQVSPCDAASDLMGAADACSTMYDRFPGLQLAIILTTEPHDQHGRQCYDDLARRCQDDNQIFVLNMGREVGNVEINVFQRAADVVIQKGLRKGFGMWMSDALWKERPCVVAPVGGLQEQVIDGQTGIVASTNEEFADAIALLLKDRELAARYGENGRKHVAQRFLITRYLRDYLGVLNDLHRRA